MNRRHFLKTASAATVSLSLGGTAFAGESTVESTPEPLRLGIDCYTLRDLDWKADQLLDYAAKVGADAIQVNLGDLGSKDDGYLRKVREHARRLGVTIEPGINAISRLSGRWNPRRQGTPTEHLLLGLRLAKALGASCVKCYMGYWGDRRSKTPIPAMMDAAIEALKTVRSQAVDAGVKFAVENHGDLLAREVKTINKRVLGAEDGRFRINEHVDNVEFFPGPNN